MGALLAVLIALATAGPARPELFLVASADGGAPARKATFFLEKHSKLTLAAVVEEAGGLFSPIEAFQEKDVRREIRDRIPPSLTVVWYRIQPKLKEYSNLWLLGNPAKWAVHLEPIEYEKTPIAAAKGKSLVDLSLLVPEGAKGTFYVCAELEGIPSSDPPLQQRFSEVSPLHLKYRSRVIQIVRRENDSYLGCLSELFGTPFIIAPRQTGAGVHETDARMGSDCAAFAIYGKRRQGFRVPYCGPAGIYRYLQEIGPGGAVRPIPRAGRAFYADSKGRPVRVGPGGLEPGDIVHFGEQVSVFYRDAGFPGILDQDDLLVQCFGDTPRVTTVRDSGFFQRPPRLFKWREDLVRSEATGQDPRREGSP